MRPLVVLSRLAVWTREREHVAALVALLALLSVAMLPLERPLDAGEVWWLQAYGGTQAHAAARGLDAGARLTLLVLAGGVALQSRRREIMTALATLASGAFVGELLKTAIERPRPSAPLGVLVGNSLPSGHIMNTTMAAGLVCVLAWHADWSLRTKRRVVLAAALAVAAQATGRVIRGSHWPSDVAPSVLLGIAWILGATAWTHMRRATRIGVVVASLAVYTLFYEIPTLRIRIPAVGRSAALHSQTMLR